MSAISQKSDVLIAGSGILGMSTAYHLAHLDPKLRITLVDVDAEGKFSSSERNAGGVRAFWEHELNRNLSLDSIAFFKKNAKALGFRQCGYLWMHRPGKVISQTLTLALQDAGYPIKTFAAKDPIPTIPWDFKRDDIGFITFHPEAGILNPNSLKQFYHQQTKEKLLHPLKHITGQVVHALEKTPTGWRVVIQEGPHGEKQLKSFYEASDMWESPVASTLEAHTVVIALGAWSERFLRKYRDVTYTCTPMARHIAFIDAPEATAGTLPMVIDPTGVYFHPEGGNLLVGYADRQQKPGYDFTYSESAFFENLVWPKLYERSEVFASCKHLFGWAGLYSYSPDQHGILGAVTGQSDLYQIHSFTGRGVMISTAAGRGLAELILTGEYKTLDLSPLSEYRFKDNNSPPPESQHI